MTRKLSCSNCSKNRDQKILRCILGLSYDQEVTNNLLSQTFTIIIFLQVVQISEDDYNAILKDGVDPSSIIDQYLTLEEGETLSNWTSVEPPKAITTKIRTKSGRIIEKTVLVSAEDYDKLKQSGADASIILGQYISAEEGNIESWEKDSKPSMRMIKTTVRTKSGRLLQKEILMDEEEYQEFLEAGQNPGFLKRFMDLKEGEVIESWQKEDTVYSVSSDEENFKAGEHAIKFKTLILTKFLFVWRKKIIIHKYSISHSV